MSHAKRDPLRAAAPLLLAALVCVGAAGALTSRLGFVASAQGSPTQTPANGDTAFVRGGNGGFQIFLRSPNGSQCQLTNFCAAEDGPCPRDRRRMRRRAVDRALLWWSDARRRAARRRAS